jgi:hypothetical protein
MLRQDLIDDISQLVSTQTLLIKSLLLDDLIDTQSAASF